MKTFKVSCYLAAGIALILGMSSKCFTAGCFTAGSISGVVTDTNFKNVSNAVVSLYVDSQFIDAEVTDASGAYSIVGLESAIYALRVEASGYEYRIETGVVVTKDNDTLKNITGLSVEGKITGKVTDASGTTMRDVLVVAFDASNPKITGRTTTDANGNFTINKLTAATYIVSARTSRYAYRAIEGIAVTPGQTISGIDLVGMIPPTGRISGTVTFSDGITPMAGARVISIDSSFLSNARQHARENIDRRRRTGQKPQVSTEKGVITSSSSIAIQHSKFGKAQPRAAIADSRGHYELNGLDTGTYVVRVMDSKGATIVNDEVSVTDGSITELNMSAHGGAISGTVVNAYRYPIEGARVLALALGNGTAYSAKTDANGDYIINNLAANTYELWLDPKNNNHILRKIKHVTVVAGRKTINQDFDLEAGGRVSGSVMDSRGRRIEGLTVVAVDPTRPANNSSAITDANGNYVISGLPNGTYTICTKADGYDVGILAGIVVTAHNENRGNHITLATR